MDYRVGDVVAGRYELIERLGKGGFGDVFRAVDLLEEQQVAVKVLGDGTDLGQVKREYRPRTGHCGASSIRTSSKLSTRW